MKFSNTAETGLRFLRPGTMAVQHSQNRKRVTDGKFLR